MPFEAAIDSTIVKGIHVRIGTLFPLIVAPIVAACGGVDKPPSSQQDLQALSLAIQRLAEKVDRLPGASPFVPEYCYAYDFNDPFGRKPSPWHVSVCFPQPQPCYDSRQRKVTELAQILRTSTDLVALLNVFDCNVLPIPPTCFDFVTTDRDACYTYCAETATDCRSAFFDTNYAPISSCSSGRPDEYRRADSRGYFCAQNPRGAAGTACGLSKAHCIKVGLEEAWRSPGFDAGQCLSVQQMYCGTGVDKRSNTVVVACADSVPACTWRINNDYGAPRTTCVQEQRALCTGK